MSNSLIHTRKLTPAIGAEISNVELTADISDDLLEEIYAALIENHVIFFRNQNISPATHMTLARALGEPQPPHPSYPQVDEFENIMVLKHGPESPPDTDGWHTDNSFSANPAFASLLVARTIPECGGDTLWTSLCRAWETLPAGIKSEVEELSAVHDFGDFRNNFSVGESDTSKLNAAYQRFGSAIHKVVQVHPVSGRKFLYVNESFTKHMVGLRTSDSNKLLDYLFHHINQPEYQVRFKWTEGAMAIWDNRCTWHYATADYLPERREMHRITIVNDARVT